MDLLPQSIDEIDFLRTTTQNNNNIDLEEPEAKINSNINSKNNYNNNQTNSNNNQINNNVKINSKTPLQNPMPNKESNSNSLKKKKSKSNDDKKSPAPKERLSLFTFSKKISQKQSNSTKITVPETESTSPKTIALSNTTSAKNSTLATPTDNSKANSGGFAEKLALIPPVPVHSAATPKQHKFVKSTSLSRLLGNSYNAKKIEREEQKRLTTNTTNDTTKFNTYAGRRRRLSGPTLERFRQCSKDDGDIAEAEATLDLRDLYGGSRNDLLSLEHPEEEDRNVDFGTKAMRTISRGLGKLWWRRSHSVEISTPDPEFKVSYLGNVLTGWAKGEGCVEKQLNTLWRNYTQNTKPDVIMRIKVCASGLKATTRQHGLTEYWANRITHCCAPKNYPRVFCWIYRHEGRKLKHELRCHAVLCSKEKIVQDICSTLKENLECALREFKRDKILKQNARLSLANAAYDNPSLPRRKILLSVGGNNYRPPLERSKSAPKLMAIEEAIGEEDGEEVEETNEPEMRSCCQKDSLYPAMTLGRRRCRRGHSIRRTGNARVPLCEHFPRSERVESKEQQPLAAVADACCSHNSSAQTKEQHKEPATQNVEQRHSYGSDDSDDFEKLLKGNNYDPSNTLANELMPFFDMQLNKQTSCSLGSLSELKHNDLVLEADDEPMSLLPTINSNPSADPAAEFCLDGQPAPESQDGLTGGVLRRSGVCSDGEEDYLDADDVYFRQAAIFNMMHRNSMRKMAHLSLSSDESSIDTNSSMQYHHQGQSSISSSASSTATSVTSAADALNSQNDAAAASAQQKCLPLDSDEGSISSGCETASTVTANQDDSSLRYRQSKFLSPQLKQLSAGAVDLELHPEEESPPISVEEIYQRLESRLNGRHGSDATTFSSSSSITLKMGSSPTPSLKGCKAPDTNASSVRSRKTRRHTAQVPQADADSDSECSDESGYVEYQERDRNARAVVTQASASKPQPPPKPASRRIVGVAKVSTTTMV